MRSRVALLSVLILALAGCGGDEGDSETTQTPGEISFDLAARGDSGVAGVRAQLVYEEKDRTTVIVDGLDEGEPGGGGANPIRLYRGSCDQLGAVVRQLEPLKGSTSKTTIRLGVSSLLDGEYAIAVALPRSQDALLACGDVPDGAPQS
jgi:hypothetical protein